MMLENQYGGAGVIRPAGRIELSNAEAFKDSLLNAVDRAESAVIVDLSDIDYISSAGLRSLMIASKAAKPKGITMGVAALQPVVTEIFTISRFHLVFPVFETVRDGLAKLAPAALAVFDESAT